MMSTQEFIADSLGCTTSECAFIDKLCEAFPRADIEDDDLAEFVRLGNPSRLQDFLIRRLFDRVVAYYTDENLENHLDEEKFDYDINSICSSLYYDGVEIYGEKDLDELIEA